MNVGVPTEVKDNEYRVGMTPAAVQVLARAGHRVRVQQGAGEGSGFTDDAYRAYGADIVSTAADVWSASDLVVKVKEPMESEYLFLRSGLILFTYLHLAALEGLTRALVESGITAIGYETVQPADGSLPLLTPMSEIAGRMSVQIGAHYLEKMNGGRGKLLGGAPGVAPAEVVIIGGGVVGSNAARIALGMGAHVTVIDRNIERLRYLEDVLHGHFTTLASNPHNIELTASYADLLVGAVLIPGGRAPKLVTRDIVKIMANGAVIVDVAVDQGGCVETCHPTTHSDPVYTELGVLHYCVTNMPGAVPRTSTAALSNVTLPYIQELANKGLERAVAADPALARGVNVHGGHVTYEAVAASLGLAYTPLADVV